MRVALIGDIHANLPALEAVLEHSAKNNADTIWNIGDFVGYGPFPEDTVKLVRSLDTQSILGNYDRKVLQVPAKMTRWQGKKHPQKIFAFQWAYEQLSIESRAYLSSLPEKLNLSTAGYRILLTHASPAARDEPLSPSTPESRFVTLAAMAQADIIVCGHSHQPFIHKTGNTWFINTGSVGRPDDGDPRACYALLDLENDQIKVSHFRLTYDLEKTITAIHKHNLPEEFAQMLIQGRNLDMVHRLR
jgi:putative phosphoesterase